MKKRATTLVLATTLGIGGLAAGAVLVPSIATAATSDTTVTDAVGDRVSRITEALAGLVSDGTITQDQADAVASTLAESLPGPGGPGGHGGPGGPGGRGGPGIEVAAETLGRTEDEVRTALEGGASLASLAEEKGVSVDTLVDALVADAKTHLDEHVADGDLTQAEADERLAEITTRITEMVQTEGLPDRGPRGAGGGPDSDSSGGDSSDSTDSGTSSPSPSSTT
jgi:polyhydroxyalkanoate synthesis regulator phasin